MTSKRANKFKKINHHLKSKQIDEKLEMLNEVPTNTISTLYVVEPEYQVQDPDIPGLPRGVDFTQDALANGRDTTGLFLEDGTILTIEPPDDLGDKSFILGPMASMWYGWGNFSTIGYIRQSDRRMVDLGRISGRLENWNGSSGFTSYGQLSLAQANWFRTTQKYANYRAFYPGPPSNTPDQYGRYYCVVTGTPKPTSYTPDPRRIPPTLGGPDSTFAPGSANPNQGKASPDLLGDLGILLAAAGIVGAAALAFKAAAAAGGASALSAIVSRLRYLAKLRMDRGALNPFGQTAVRSGAAGRQRVDVYSGRPYQGPRGNRSGIQYGTTNQQTGNTYTNPGPLKGMPGTGSQTNPAGTLDKGTLPQRYVDKYGSRSVLGQPQVKMTPRVAKRVFGESVDLVKVNDLSNDFIEKLFSQYLDPYEKVDQLLSNIEKYLKSKKPTSESKEYIVESRKKIIKDLKKSYQLPEEKKEKIKHRPRVIGSQPRMINSDLMKKAEVPSSFKKAEERVWTKYNKQQNARWSQERKNEILDHLGGSDHAWEWLTETSRQKNQDIMYGHFGGDKKKKVVRKEEIKGDTLLFIVDENGKKENILQSELSIKLADEFNKELFQKYFQEQETLQADKDPLFRKVSKKLKTQIDYPDKPSMAGYPNDPPPEMINGWHPEYGQDKGYYNKLDPQSANAMPQTGNPEIDAKVRRAKTLKKVLGKGA
jgi:hypothetical protein